MYVPPIDKRQLNIKKNTQKSLARIQPQGHLHGIPYGSRSKGPSKILEGPQSNSRESCSKKTPLDRNHLTTNCVTLWRPSPVMLRDPLSN